MTVRRGARQSLTLHERRCLQKATALPFGTPVIATLSNLRPLLSPIRTALEGRGYRDPTAQFGVQRALIRSILHLGTVPQSWTTAEWVKMRELYAGREQQAFTLVAILGYGARAAPDSELCAVTQRLSLARHLYGRERIESECERMLTALAKIGYRIGARRDTLQRRIAELLLHLGSATLDAADDESFAVYAKHHPRSALLRTLSVGLAELGIISRPLNRYVLPDTAARVARATISGEWLSWCERWRTNSSNAFASRDNIMSGLLAAGRWLATHHAEIKSPAMWTGELARGYVRHVSNQTVNGSLHPKQLKSRAGEPLKPNSRKQLLSSIRVFFRELQEWEWIGRHFNPDRVFSTPRQITRALQYNPRPIDDGHWLKLRSAALSLQAEDLPLSGHNNRRYQYPIELVRAVAVAWTFSGCRANEIGRLEAGCVYVEHVPAQTDQLSGEAAPAFDQYMLRVPVSKTSGEFVKPIEEPMGTALLAWERMRPKQRRLLDATTGQLTDYLFCYQGQRIGKDFLNRVIIPLLLRKAGLPSQDSRGSITSHRARATMATKLYNSTSGLTPLEVMRWLGHTQLTSGQHYIALSPTRLMTTFHQRTKLAEHLRSISVLVDRRPEPGQPAIFYDLGHGWCTNDAYASCAHRMACARCGFYVPADSSKAALLKQSSRFIRMLQELTLTEDERAAITGDAKAVEQLLERLADEPLPRAPE